MSKDQQGLYSKFEVSRADGGELPPDAKFLVLRLDEHGDSEETQAARSAAKFYARQVGNETLRRDLLANYPANSSTLPYRMVPKSDLLEADQLTRFGKLGWLRPRDVVYVSSGSNPLVSSVRISLKSGEVLSERFDSQSEADAALESYGSAISKVVNVRGDI